MEPLCEIVMSNAGRRPKKEKHKCCQLDFSGILLFLGLFLVQFPTDTKGGCQSSGKTKVK